ncbi:hypothetical protein BGZ57DRAFT_441075 [Hyaloscypha finlandica]|nr:hypothetical protein BGZ57DRAFT_441075 [Hyaloscypha finlandica]
MPVATALLVLANMAYLCAVVNCSDARVSTMLWVCFGRVGWSGWRGGEVRIWLLVEGYWWCRVGGTRSKYVQKGEIFSHEWHRGGGICSEAGF